MTKPMADIAERFNLPENIVPFAIVVIGHPAEAPKQPENRFQSMEEMAEALLKVQAILDDQGAGISNYVEVGPSKHNEVYLAPRKPRSSTGFWRPLVKT